MFETINKDLDLFIDYIESAMPVVCETNYSYFMFQVEKMNFKRQIMKAIMLNGKGDFQEIINKNLWKINYNNKKLTISKSTNNKEILEEGVEIFVCNNNIKLLELKDEETLPIINYYKNEIVDGKVVCNKFDFAFSKKQGHHKINIKHIVKSNAKCETTETLEEPVKFF